MQATKINWKDADKALTKLYPRGETTDEDDEMVPGDPGSFFNFFENDDDPAEVGFFLLLMLHIQPYQINFTQIGLTIGNEIFPEAIDYFLGNAGGEELDSDDEEDDDDEDAEEIDLEKPRSKKQKV